MKTLFNIFLVIHIIAGATGLITGTISIIRKKGDKIHKLIGKIFLFGMQATGFSALILSILHPNIFLFSVGVFTIYLTGSGTRFLSLKKLGEGQKPALIDWLLTISMLVFGGILISFGAYKLISGNVFGSVFCVFGTIGFMNALQDIKLFRGKITEANYWLLAHLGKMTGGYIAAFTAFLVVNLHHLPFIPSVVGWLLPTALFTPLIFFWSAKYKSKRK